MAATARIRMTTAAILPLLLLAAGLGASAAVAVISYRAARFLIVMAWIAVRMLCGSLLRRFR